MNTRNLFIAFAVAGLLLGLGIRAATRSVAHAQHAGHGTAGAEKPASPAKPPAEPEAAGKGGILVDLGNEDCPIMGKAVNGRTWSEWNGLRIGHCCPPCIGKLLADPEKGLDEAGIEWRELAALVAKASAAKGAERTRILAVIAKNHEIVRDPHAAPKAIYADLGNESCPVMGGKVDGETFTYWNGLRIGHCCPGCTGPLLKSPEKILDEKGIEWRETARAVALAAVAEGEDRAKRIAALKKDRVVVDRAAPPVIDLGNARCPVMGGKVDGKTYTVWNGLRIGHCCPGCTVPLLKNPEEQLDAKKIEWRDAAKLIAKIENASDAERAKLTAEAKRRFDIVGEE